ncbi:MAG TPA: amidohydrolase family protein [Candidatus Kapabacteria bacterium]|nr:amidohydrolase family protein [Candidatus Kapabacteria bacterium]
MQVSTMNITMTRIVLRAAALLLLAALASTGLHAQMAAKGTFALVGARLETVSHGMIPNGTVVIRDGKIVAVGPNVTPPGDAQVIDCAGMTIYPGFIDAGTELGLVEVGSLPETQDADEMGEITPQMQALTAVNPNSVSIPITRTSGVTTVITAPTGGLFPGTAALINLLGYTPDQMLVGNYRAMVMNFPSSARPWWDDRPDDEAEKSMKKAKDRLADAWQRAVLYARIDSGYHAGRSDDRVPEFQPELAALAPVVRGTMPVMIEVNAARDIDSALAWVKANKVRAIFTGVAEGWRVADRIAAAGVPCIVGPVISMPSRSSDRYDKAYANAGLLRKAGVQVAIRTSENSNVRNLPYNAGFAAAYGMGREEALRAVTIVPAQMFGVDSLLGSLDVGKQATLFVADGDPFEPATNVRDLFIDGYKVPMTNRQIELYKEFIKREPGLAK